MVAIAKQFSKDSKLEDDATSFRLDDVLEGIFSFVLNAFGVTQVTKTKRQQNAIFALALILAAQFAAMAPCFAQTKPATVQQSTLPQGDSQVPSQDGQQTQNTVPNPYDDAVGQMYQVNNAVPQNQNNINTQVTNIITGAPPAPLVFQAAEQGQGAQIQQSAVSALNQSLGSVNDTYRGLHQWFKDDLVANLFSNIGQLIGKWLTELIDGWIADTAQFLAKFLRVFVLNPNIAVNGLNGSQNDGISAYIRQGADVMYGIAVDLLLLLFICCIWKFWADASWQGAGNLMGPVGRLIFTAGLLLAWPTIYAFEIQISNEMIKAIYFNSADQVLMLDYALAQAVKGGVIAAGAGATSVFAPLLANLAIPVAGQFVGQLFYFASIMIFTILGGILIAELVYILILKAVQTALLTAQYMFAPIFLVFFATPDTESYATGYVRAFVETSLWTFVWVGLLKVMTIILFSNFNPWGKILISIGVLQMMIQVPSFLGRAQISPVSDFITAGLVFGTVSKAITGLGTGLTSAVGNGVSWFTDGRFADKGLQQTKDAGMNGLPSKTANPELLNGLNKASATERGRDPNALKDGPASKPGAGDAVTSAMAGAALGKNMDASLAPGAKPTGKPEDKPPVKIDPMGAKLDAKPPELTDKPGEKPPVKIDPMGTRLDTKATAADGKPGDKPPIKVDTPDPKLNSKPPEKTNETISIPGSTKAGLKTAAGVVGAAAVGGALAAALETGGGPGGTPGNPELPKGAPPGDAGKQPGDRYEWSKQSAAGWNEANLIHVDTRKMLGQLTSVAGVGLRVGQKRTSALGSTAHGVQRINIAEGASESEMAHGIYAAAFANNVSSDDPARDAARVSAIQSNGHQPRGVLENMAANWLSNTGSSWNKTALSKQRFQQSMFEQAVHGSQAYVSRQKGNAYTDYLRGRYGEWGDEQDAMAVHLITNPESSESPWNRNIGPATDALVSSGIPIGADTRGAMQNMAVQGMHPARRKQAVFAALSYTYNQCKELYGNEPPAVFSLAHGEMARKLTGDQVNQAMAIYQQTGQDDLCTPMAQQFMATTAAMASGSNVPFDKGYACMATAAPRVAQHMRNSSGAPYLRSDANLSNIQSLTDLSTEIIPGAGESRAQAMQKIMVHAGNNLSTMQSYNIPMEMVNNAAVAPELFSALSHITSNIPGGLNSYQGSSAMRVIARNLGTVGAPHTARAIEAMYEYQNQGGRIEQLDQARIILAERAFSEGGKGAVSSHVIEMAANSGYAGRAPGESIPWDDMKKAVPYFASGQVRDHANWQIVSNLVDSKIPVNQQNIRLAVESMASNGGNLDADHLSAVVRVGTDVTKNASSAPIVLDTFARAQAQHHGINTSNMNFNEVLKELESRSPGTSASSMAQQIVQISRSGGKLSDHQLTDPVTVQMLVDPGNDHPYAPQAINVVTTLVGSSQAMAHPQYINVVEEYLDNNGKMKDMSLGGLNAAVALAEARAAGKFGADSGNVRIGPQVLKMVQGDSSYSIQDNHINDELIQKIIRAQNKFAGGGGGGGGGSP